MMKSERISTARLWSATTRRRYRLGRRAAPGAVGISGPELVFRKVKAATSRRTPYIALAVLVLAGCIPMAFAVRGYVRRQPAGAPVSLAAPTGQSPPTQATGALRYKLARQPEANRMRFRLGERFTGAGREMSVLNGTLTIGAQQQRVHIVRRQDDDDENLSITVGAASLTWSGKQGALANGKTAAASDRALIERLALDSPDQFVLAQLRGASYYTVARNVRPASAGESDDYAGPVWDLVRGGEPERS